MAGGIPTHDEVKAARIAAGLTQQQAADLVGVTLSAWQRWETPPEMSSARRISPAAWRSFRVQTGTVPGRAFDDPR
ncbi:helix-turn-helix domain-containing protein [Methylobacterium aquaticum]|uniref:helix-turn-helix domain-containing protein n=1 Tax=Methylobacterium aquaticum TaxID=270351 RepID=UPI003D17A7CE